MAKIETTAKLFKKGIEVRETRSTVKWDPTGHLSVRVLDASGAMPLAGREINVEIPGEGNVALTSDRDGAIFYPDVPFKDYQLDLGDGVTAEVPAVAARSEQHVCAVPSVQLAWVDLEIVDHRGIPVSDRDVTVNGVALVIDKEGHARMGKPLPANEGKASVHIGEVELEAPLPVLALRTLVWLPKSEKEPA